MRYLVTGLPGTGKTTVGKELQNSCFEYIDSDYYPGLAKWYNTNTGEAVSKSPNPDAKWYEEHDWNWDEDFLKIILAKYSKNSDVVVCGITSNITNAFHLFDKVFLLKAEYTILRKRLIDRSDNPDLESIDTIFKWAKAFEAKVIKHRITIIDATLSPELIAKDIINDTYKQ